MNENPLQFRVELTHTLWMSQNHWTWIVSLMDGTVIARGSTHFRIVAKWQAKRALRKHNHLHLYSEKEIW